jgi:hypothetical protein
VPAGGCRPGGAGRRCRLSANLAVPRSAPSNTRTRLSIRYDGAQVEHSPPTNRKKEARHGGFTSKISSTLDLNAAGWNDMKTSRAYSIRREIHGGGG